MLSLFFKVFNVPTLKCASVTDQQINSDSCVKFHHRQYIYSYVTNNLFKFLEMSLSPYCGNKFIIPNTSKFFLNFQLMTTIIFVTKGSFA